MVNCLLFSFTLSFWLVYPFALSHLQIICYEKNEREEAYTRAYWAYIGPCLESLLIGCLTMIAFLKIEKLCSLGKAAMDSKYIMACVAIIQIAMGVLLLLSTDENTLDIQYPF